MLNMQLLIGVILNQLLTPVQSSITLCYSNIGYNNNEPCGIHVTFTKHIVDPGIQYSHKESINYCTNNMLSCITFCQVKGNQHTRLVPCHWSVNQLHENKRQQGCIRGWIQTWLGYFCVYIEYCICLPKGCNLGWIYTFCVHIVNCTICICLQKHEQK